ncbi:MAG: T9SS type A sorting domain-containing protein [Bacteroidales bacterium]|nr:T9SS type A sorting domain-containing protein [Bacteroidales bacterium]
MKTLKYQLIAILSLAFCIAQAQSPTVGEVLTASDGTTGVVFYVSPDGNTFWLAAMNDLPGTYQWGPIGDVAGLENYESANDAIWYALHYESIGLEATQIMYHDQGYNSAYPASRVNFKHGWHIPSTGQLSKLYAALPYVNHVFTQNGGTEMTYDYYWASTESSSQQAWAVNFDDNSYKGGFLQEFDKLTQLHVRPIWSSEIISSSPTVGEITTPETICSGNSLDLHTPSTQYATHQGWQIAADEDFTDYQAYNGETLDESFDGWYLRYFASNHLGTVYSNTVQISVLHASVSSFDINSCGSYTWNSETYTESGIYQQYFPMPNGCDSIVTLHLTIEHEYSTTLNITSCDFFTWNGATYTQSGDHEQSFTTQFGCDSIVTLHLTINPSTTHEFMISTCDSYIWNDTEYFESGDYEQTFTSSTGCDSIVTMHLSIETFDEMQAIEGDTEVDSYLTPNSVFVQSGFMSGSIYQWSIEPAEAGSIIGSGNTVIVNWTPDFKGNATLTVNINNACGEGNNAITVNVKNTFDVSENSINAKLYPNPTSGDINIEVPGMQHITITNTLGQTVVDMELDADTSSINMAQFGTGMYLIRIQTENSSCTKRFRVE